MKQNGVELVVLEHDLQLARDELRRVRKAIENRKRQGLPRSGVQTERFDRALERVRELRRQIRGVNSINAQLKGAE